MSSKRKKMNNLKRLTRSQTKAKKASKATNNIVPTEASASIYNGVLLGNNIEVPPFDERVNEGNTIRMDEKQGEEIKKDNIEENSHKAISPSYDEARILFNDRITQENKNIQMDRKSAMKIENDQKLFFQQNNIPLKDNINMTKKADYEVKIEEMNKLLQISEENLRRQQAEEEIRRIQEKIYENSRKLDNLQTGRSFQNLDSNRSHQIGNNTYANKNNIYDEDYMQNQNMFNRNVDKNNFNRSNYEQDLGMDRLIKKFSRIEKVKNPRDDLGYFQEEFHRLNIRDDYVKYNILIEKWLTEDVSNFYKLVDREHRNFETFCDFCVNRDNSLSEILSKIPQYDTSTPFGVFLADATKYAKAVKKTA